MPGIMVGNEKLEIDVGRMRELAAAAVAGFFAMLQPEECQCPNCTARRAAEQQANKHGLN